jgi:hypothetical protein
MLAFFAIHYEFGGGCDCEDRAAASMKNNGKQEVCYGRALAQCNKTGTLVCTFGKNK